MTSRPALLLNISVELVIVKRLTLVLVVLLSELRLSVFLVKMLL